MSDEQLVALSNQGDIRAQEMLIDRYKGFVRAKARGYFIIGADRDDIIQEGMIGLYKAMRDFRPEKITHFRLFADICVTRQIITAVKASTRQKHIPLNSYVSLNKPVYDEESDRTLMDMLSSLKTSSPEDQLINQESFEHIEGKIAQLLSDFEFRVLLYYRDGKSYEQIAKVTGRHAKAVDNALQRIKRKLERYLKQEKAQQ